MQNGRKNLANSGRMTTIFPGMKLKKLLLTKKPIKIYFALNSTSAKNGKAHKINVELKIAILANALAAFLDGSNINVRHIPTAVNEQTSKNRPREIIVESSWAFGSNVLVAMSTHAGANLQTINQIK